MRKLSLSPVSPGRRPALLFHFVRRLPGAGDDFADAAHGLRIGTHHADGAEVVQNILGGDGLAANPAFGKRHVLRQIRVEMMADHQHVEMLVNRVDRVRAGGIGGTGQHVRLAANADDVRRVAAAGAFGVIGVNRAAFERGNGAFDKAGFVQGVGMNRHLHVVFVRDAQTAINRGGSRAPIFVQLQADGAGLEFVPANRRAARCCLCR